MKAPSKPDDPSEKLSEPVLTCPSCSGQAFTLSEDFNSFECKDCKYSEAAGECVANIVCNSQKIPESYLSEWSDDGGICEYCDDHIRDYKD